MRDALFAQDYDGFYDVWFSRDNPHVGRWREVYRNIQLNYEKMRRVMLAENYSAVWIVESDTIPPRDALTKLLAIPAPVVSGLYALRHGDPIPNLMQFGRMPGVGTAFSWEQVRSAWGETVRISGGCTGCLLVRRPVLENFEFTLPHQGAPDVALMEYCWSQGFAQAGRLDVVCGHKKPDGQILMPIPDAPGWELRGWT